SAEVFDLNASLQEKVLVITALKKQLNKLKGKAVLTEAVSLNPIDPELLKVDVAPLVLKFHKNRTAYTDYIRHTKDEAAILREIVERQEFEDLPLKHDILSIIKDFEYFGDIIYITDTACPIVVRHESEKMAWPIVVRHAVRSILDDSDCWDSENCKIPCSFKNSNTQYTPSSNTISFYHLLIKQVIFNHNFSMTTLANKAILSGADNRLPMLEKDMYELWKIKMELYMMNRQHGHMILESVEKGPLIWPTVEENGVTRPKKYSELTPSEVIQADCDVKATVGPLTPVDLYLLY
nr:hypothetical protein [Tanacetum cinerariifolium]